MNKIFLFTFLLLITTIKINAQSSDSYVKFTSEQIEIAKKISKEEIKIEIHFNKGVEYQNKYFWFVTTTADKKYYFNSDKTFTEVIYEQEDYLSLMEYIIEESDF